MYIEDVQKFKIEIKLKKISTLNVILCCTFTVALCSTFNVILCCTFNVILSCTFHLMLCRILFLFIFLSSFFFLSSSFRFPRPVLVNFFVVFVHFRLSSFISCFLSVEGVQKSGNVRIENARTKEKEKYRYFQCLIDLKSSSFISYQYWIFLFVNFCNHFSFPVILFNFSIAI